MNFEKLILQTATDMHRIQRQAHGIKTLEIGDEVLTPDFQTGYVEAIDIDEDGETWVTVGLDDGETWEGTSDQLGGYDPT